MDPIRVTIKNNLQKLSGSLKNRIPTITVPTAPIPVHTAYAVPIGKVCVAFIKSNILMVKAIKNPAYHPYMVIPDVAFALPKQKANVTSNNPAIISIIQFIK